jgi:outer membrane lipoprotein-sorting protein
MKAGMMKLLAAPFALLLLITPAFAAVDRDTAVSTLASLYNSADTCKLIISRAKVDAYAEANRPADDSLFNVDVFRATQKLYADQKTWTDEQTKAYCAKAAETVRTLDMGL